MLYLGCNMYYQRERERKKKENTPKKRYMQIVKQMKKEKKKQNMDLVPSQVAMLLSSWNPFLHEHSKEPGVLRQF